MKTSLLSSIREKIKTELNSSFDARIENITNNSMKMKIQNEALRNRVAFLEDDNARLRRVNNNLTAVESVMDRGRYE